MVDVVSIVSVVLGLFEGCSNSLSDCSVLLGVWIDIKPLVVVLGAELSLNRAGLGV